MGKGERKQATKMATDASAKINAQGDATQSQLQDDLTGAKAEATDTMGKAKESLLGMGGPTGAYDPEKYAKTEAQNDQNIKTGGYDPAQLEKTRGDINTNIGTGGYDPGQVDKLRGGYESLIKTGGLDDATAGAMRRQAAGASQAVYSTLGTNMARKQAAAGFGGAGGETAQMARQAGQSAAVATTGANAEIGKLKQSGTIAGLGGATGLEGDIAHGKTTAVGQEAGLEGDVAKGTLEASKANQDLATGAAQQKIQAAGGLINLVNSDPGYVKTLVQGILESQRTTGQLTTAQSQIMQEISKQPGAFQTALGDIVALSGAAAGLGKAF